MKKLTVKNKFGYGLGDLGNGLTFAMSSMFLLAFYVDVLGITAASVGTLFLVARIWDAINDPMMGALTDKLLIKRMAKYPGEKVDKFRPYLLKGSFLVVVAATLMFFAPDGLSPMSKLVWAYVTYIFWGMMYTFVNIPYGSLAAVMTQDPAERASLSVARGLGGMFGNMIPSIILPIILTRFTGEGENGYFIAMLGLGILAVISYLIAYATTEENIVHKVDPNASKVSFKESFAVLKKNRPFIGISIASIAMLLGFMIMGAMSIFYFRDNLNALGMMTFGTLIRAVPLLVLAPALKPLVKKFGTKNVVSYASLLSAISYFIMYIMPDNIVTYLSVGFVGSLFMTVPNMLIWGMVSDSIDYNQYLCGRRQEGVIYGSYSFVRKMGQAFAGFIAGMGVGLIGYDSTLAQQTARTLAGTKFLTIAVPGISMIIAFVAFKFVYNLTEEKQKEVIAKINSESQLSS